jgi:hypothetical protein
VSQTSDEVLSFGREISVDSFIFGAFESRPPRQSHSLDNDVPLRHLRRLVPSMSTHT